MRTDCRAFKKALPGAVANLLSSGALAGMCLCSLPATGQPLEDRVADAMTDGWRNAAWVDLVKPNAGNKKELVFARQSERESNERIKNLIRLTEQRFELPGSRASLFSERRVVLMERYLAGKVDQKSTPIGNSMSKSLVALTVGKALCDGSIKNLNDPAAYYVKDLSGSSWGSATLRNLLTMSSGAFKADPSDTSGWKNPADGQANRALYAKGLQTDYIEMMKKLDDRAAPPGKEFNYNNYDTIALALVVEAATQKRFAKYFEEVIWHEVGAENDGAWIKNNRGQIAGYLGFSATARDWLRLGHYVLDQLQEDNCFSKFLKEATKEQITANWRFNKSYGYQIWTNCSARAGSFCFLGFGGQQLIMHPGSQTVLYVHATNNSLVGPWRQVFEGY